MSVEFFSQLAQLFFTRRSSFFGQVTGRLLRGRMIFGLLAGGGFVVGALCFVVGALCFALGALGFVVGALCFGLGLSCQDVIAR